MKEKFSMREEENLFWNYIQYQRLIFYKLWSQPHTDKGTVYLAEQKIE